MAASRGAGRIWFASFTVLHVLLAARSVYARDRPEHHADRHTQATPGRQVSEAADARLVIQVAPAQVALRPNGPSSVAFVEAAVPNGADVEDIVLTPTVADGITADFRPMTRVGTGDAIWKVALSTQSEAGGNIQIPFVVSWRIGTAGPRESAVASLSVVVQPAVAASVVVSLDKDFLELTEIGDHPVTLFVENKSAVPLHVESIKPLSTPSFISVNFTNFQSGTAKPGATIAINGDMTLGRIYSPRPHKVSLLIVISSLDGTIRFEKTADMTVDVAVPAIGDVMKAAEIPSLALLPGLITLVAATFLRKRLFAWRKTRRQDEGGKPDEEDWKNPGFWILSVTLSGLISWAALRFLKIDLSDSYSLGEVILLWLLSLTVFPALLLPTSWALGMPLDIIAGWLQHWKRDRYRISEQDDAAAVIKKLRLGNLGFYWPTVSWPERGRQGHLFLLPRNEDEETGLWGVPPIVITGKRYPADKAGHIDSLLDDPTRSSDLLKTVLEESGQLRRGFRAFMSRKPCALAIGFENGPLDKPMKLATHDVKSASIGPVPRSLLRRGRTW